MDGKATLGQATKSRLLSVRHVFSSLVMARNGQKNRQMGRNGAGSRGIERQVSCKETNARQAWWRDNRSARRFQERRAGSRSATDGTDLPRIAQNRRGSYAQGALGS